MMLTDISDSLRKDFRLLGDDPEADKRFDEMMDAICKSDTAKLLDTIKQATGDKISPELWEEMAQGKIFTGEEALINGLIHEVGSLSKILHRDFPNAEVKFHRRNDIGMMIRNNMQFSTWIGMHTITQD